MSERMQAALWEPVQAHKVFATAWLHAKAMLIAGHRLTLAVAPETRSQAQNRLMWPLLVCFSQQVQWPVNARMEWMCPEDWKDVLTAAFRREQVRMAQGLDGGMVLLGQRTSKFSKKEFADWIEFLYATAADRGVKLPVWTGMEE